MKLSPTVSIDFTSRERIALRQALIDEIEKLTKNRFLDKDKIENRIIICHIFPRGMRKQIKYQATE